MENKIEAIEHYIADDFHLSINTERFYPIISIRFYFEYSNNMAECYRLLLDDEAYNRKIILSRCGNVITFDVLTGDQIQQIYETLVEFYEKHKRHV